MCLTNAQAYVLIVWLKRTYHKYSLNHILLLLFYALFITVSASIFFVVEYHHVDNFRRSWNRKVDDNRKRFITKGLFPEIFNNSRLLLYVHGDKSDYLHLVVERNVREYEQQLRLRPPMPVYPPTFKNSLLFVMTTITTIGHSFIYPVTVHGKTVSMLVALFGVPFTIVIVKDVAYLLVILFDLPCRALEKIWAIFRFCTLRPSQEAELERKLYGGEGRQRSQDYRIQHTDRLLSLPVTLAVLALIGWITVGVILMHFAYPRVTTANATYFIINTLSTIGSAAVDIPEPSFLEILCSFVYTIVGLSVVSLFINLLHAKFSNAYWLSGKLYLPLGNHGDGGARNLATSESFEEMTVSDMPINHIASLGILQADSKRPLLAVMKSDTAMRTVVTQTSEATCGRTILATDQQSLPPIDLPLEYQTSRDDVNELLIERYGTTRTLFH